jgi:integrase
MRKTLTDKGVAALKPRATRYTSPDPELRGHYVRVLPSGTKTFYAVTRGPDGKQIWTVTGDAGTGIDTARDSAREILRRVRAGLAAVEPAGDSFAAVVDNWRKRHVEKNALRSAVEINRLLNAHVLPAWGTRPFASIRKSDIAALLDRIEDKHGARAADYTLGIIRNLMNWYAARSDDFRPPVFRGMRRQSTHAQRRSRVLDDAELIAIWSAAETAGTYGALVQLLLLTAQRLDKVLTMQWDEIDSRGDWTIPKAAREKDNAGVLGLPEPARAILAKLPRFVGNPYVLAGRVGHINGMSKAKARLDKVSGVTGWTLHDLRRTARSLMSRAGVSSEHAERVMGHAIVGVEGIYDRHSYKAEKAHALARLAGLIERILHAPGADVIELAEARS